MQINDEFATRLDALRAFGFEGAGLQQAIWKIPVLPPRYVWLANLGQYAGGLNELSSDGRIFIDRRDLNEAGANNYGHHGRDEVERFLFIRTAPAALEVRFMGVFMPDREKSILNVSAWKRVANECRPPYGIWQPEIARR